MSEAIDYDKLIGAFEAHSVERAEYLLRVSTLAERIRVDLLGRLGLRNQRDVYLVRPEDLCDDPARRSVPVQKAVAADRAVDLLPGGWAAFGVVIAMRKRPQDHPAAFTGVPLEVRRTADGWEVRCQDVTARSSEDEVGPLVDLILKETLRAWTEGFDRWRAGESRICRFGFYV